jgi:hypothetical protein
MSYDQIKEINVDLFFGNLKYREGRLAISDGIIYFEYDTDFIVQCQRLWA